MSNTRDFSKQYEPSEKRLIVGWSQARRDLRQGHFPRLLVTAAQAKIVSHMSNEKFDLYILSESTLIISDFGFLLITCGQTQLINAVKFVHQKLGHIAQYVSFSRQRELYPDLQPTTFASDVVALNSMFLGSNLIVNSDFFKFDYFLSRNRQADFFATQSTRSSLLCKPLLINDLETTRTIIGAEFLKQSGWQVEDHLFDPWGYSLNAVKGEHYMTMHMSVSGQYMYVTGETNASFAEVDKHWRKSLTGIAARIEFTHNKMGQPMMRQQSVGLNAA